MKMIRGITWKFSPEVAPKTAADYNRLVESDQAWMVLIHKDTEIIRMPLSKFDMEPEYLKLYKLLPIHECRIMAPVWAVWRVDTVDVPDTAQVST